MVGNFVADEIAPVAHHMDANPLKLVDGEVEGSKEYDAIFENLAKWGFMGSACQRIRRNECTIDGVHANAELFARADVSL